MVLPFASTGKVENFKVVSASTSAPERIPTDSRPLADALSLANEAPYGLGSFQTADFMMVLG